MLKLRVENPSNLVQSISKSFVVLKICGNFPFVPNIMTGTVVFHFTNVLLYYCTSVLLTLVHFNSSKVEHKYTSTVLFQYSITLVHIYNSKVEHQYSSTLVNFYSSKGKHQYTITLMHQYISTPVHKYTSIVENQYSNTLVNQYISAPVHQYTST